MAIGTMLIESRCNGLESHPPPQIAPPPQSSRESASRPSAYATALNRPALLEARQRAWEFHGKLSCFLEPMDSSSESEQKMAPKQHND